MTATKQKPAPDFTPGAFYERDDGMIMVEVAPGHFVNEVHAQLHYGVSVKKEPVSR